MKSTAAEVGADDDDDRNAMLVNAEDAPWCHRVTVAVSASSEETAAAKASISSQSNYRDFSQNNNNSP